MDPKFVKNQRFARKAQQALNIKKKREAGPRKPVPLKVIKSRFPPKKAVDPTKPKEDKPKVDKPVKVKPATDKPAAAAGKKSASKRQPAKSPAAAPVEEKK